MHSLPIGLQLITPLIFFGYISSYLVDGSFAIDRVPMIPRVTVIVIGSKVNHVINIASYPVEAANQSQSIYTLVSELANVYILRALDLLWSIQLAIYILHQLHI